MTVYYKMGQILLKNVTVILLYNSTFYYKMRQLLQIATILLQNATVITRRDVYHKLQQYKLWDDFAIYKIYRRMRVDKGRM